MEEKQLSRLEQSVATAQIYDTDKERFNPLYYAPNDKNVKFNCDVPGCQGSGCYSGCYVKK